MKILLVGAGSIGGTTAVMLKEHGVDIDIAEANKARAEMIRTEGLRLTGALGDHCQKLTCYTDVSEITELYDVCIIATKYFALQAVARAYLPVVKENGLFVSMQNGICTGRLAEVVGKNRTVGCMIGFGATLLPDGNINVTSKGELVIGRLNGRMDQQIAELAYIYNNLLPTRAVKNIDEYLYSKLIVNSCINSIAPLTGQTVGVMMQSDKAKAVFLEIAREATFVSKKLGMHVPPYAKVLNYNLLILSEAKWFKKLCASVTGIVGKRFGDVRPSTLQALDRGEKTEIDIFNGYIIEQGKKAGVPTPVNQQIYDFIKAIEAGTEKPCMENLDRISI